MSSSPNCYSASMGVFTKATCTRNGQNVNEQKCLSSSPNPYSASKAVFTQATLTRNEQNTNEQNCSCHLLPILIQLLKQYLHKQLQQGMDKTPTNKHGMSLSPNPYSASKGVFAQATSTRNGQNVNKQKCSCHLPILIQLLKRCLHKRLQQGMNKVSMNNNAHVTSQSLFSF